MVGSTGMQHPIPTLALSNTLRASIWGWLKTLSGEVAKDGVTMNVLAPGTILTDRVTSTTTARAKAKGVSFDEALAEAAARDPGRAAGHAGGLRADGCLPGEREGRLRHRQHDPGGWRPGARDGLKEGRGEGILPGPLIYFCLAPPRGSANSKRKGGSGREYFPSPTLRHGIR